MCRIVAVLVSEKSSSAIAEMFSAKVFSPYQLPTFE
jgi:hypothetical protein